MNCHEICVDDMKLILLPPSDNRKPTEAEIESETLKLITIFAGIKQRVLRENKNHHQCIPLIRL